MQTAVLHDERPEASSTVPVITAREVVRRYGEGDTAVEALRGVSLDIARGKLTAVMGPSGSGKSTLMHILAGLDRPTEGRVEIEGTDITGLDDTALTKLRRDHIGFIFEFFNLLPMLTAAENIVLPQKLAGTKIDKAWLDGRTAKVGLGARLTHRPSRASRAASSSGSPSPARSSRARASCSPTSRRATSTPPPAARSSRSCATRSTRSARRR